MSRLAQFGVPVLLALVLVGCGKQPAEVAQNAPPPELKNEDPGLGIDPNLPDIDRRDKQKVDGKVTDESVGIPDVLRDATAPIVPPGTAIPGLPPVLALPAPLASDPGYALAGSGGSVGVSGRSGATRLAKVSAAGGGGRIPFPMGMGAGGPMNGTPKPEPATGYNALNAEAYGVYRENEFRSPRVAALSTFSADVNTAAYANVRRILKEGKLPPANAVFLAEFVNYFRYDYAQPKGDDPIAFHMEMGPCPWNRNHHLLRVGVQAREIAADKIPPRNLVFLVDTSGSMSQANRLPLVQQSLSLLVQKLTEKDRVSIVTYAGSSSTALTPTKGSEKDVILSAINSLSAGGGTNGEGGIRAAYKLAGESFIKDGANRVILCTDGDFNVGVTDNGELVKLVEEQRKSNVFLSVLGFGMGNYKDDRLKQLANNGNGQHGYIDTLAEAKKVFLEDIGGLVCVAKDVKFQIDFNSGKINAYRLVGYENRLLADEDFKNDAKDAGDMGSGHQVTVLYEIVPTGVKIDLPAVDPSKYTQPVKPAGPQDEWLTVKMRYKQPTGDVSKELSAPFKGEVAKDLSDDFRFAAATASFGTLLRGSKHAGAMTYAGVLEEAQGCLGKDPNGHRKGFLDLVTTARNLAAAPIEGDAALATALGMNAERLKEFAAMWAKEKPEVRAFQLEVVSSGVPSKFHAPLKAYFEKAATTEKK